MSQKICFPLLPHLLVSLSVNCCLQEHSCRLKAADDTSLLFITLRYSHNNIFHYLSFGAVKNPDMISSLLHIYRHEWGASHSQCATEAAECNPRACSEEIVKSKSWERSIKVDWESWRIIQHLSPNKPTFNQLFLLDHSNQICNLCTSPALQACFLFQWLSRS